MRLTALVVLTLAFAAMGTGPATATDPTPADVLAITSPADGATVSVTPTIEGTYLVETFDNPVDVNGDGFVVVAIVDTGINPYNPDFAATPSQPSGHPSTYITGFPEGAESLELACTETTNIPTNCAPDFAGVGPNKLYTIPGTKIIGAASFSQGTGFGPSPILDDHSHGTRTASVAVGNYLGTCPECLLVVAEGFAGAGKWAAEQPWIDIVSNSWGRTYSLGFTGVADGDAMLGATKPYTEAGGTVLFAAGNGIANAFAVTHDTYKTPYTGADWHVVVGAVVTGSDGPDEDGNGERSVMGSGKPVTISSYGSGDIDAACHQRNTLDCQHSGTSSATPIAAGVMGAVLSEAKRILGETDEGPVGDGVAAAGTNAVEGNPYLGDGELAREELWELVFNTARPLESSAGAYPGNGPGAPADYAYAGYGIVNAWSRDDALAHLTTGTALPERLDVDEFMAYDSQMRRGNYGVWSEYKTSNIDDATPANAPYSSGPFDADDLLRRVPVSDRPMSTPVPVATDVVELTFTGPGGPGSVDAVLDPVAGTWSYTVAAALPAGDYTVAAEHFRDVAGSKTSVAGPVSIAITVPSDPPPPPADADQDGVLDSDDNCVDDPNSDQADLDGDGAGDACDDDKDGDGVLNTSDNCPGTSNADQKDTNDDGAGDACVDDWDGDGTLNIRDNCPTDANPAQRDFDNDGAGDACDTDDDDDGFLDDDDNCPFDVNTNQLDRDEDGIGDACDPDRDGDGVQDVFDAFPDDPDESVDTDRDGIGDNADPDADGDGVLDNAADESVQSTSNERTQPTGAAFKAADPPANDKESPGIGWLLPMLGMAVLALARRR